MAKKSKKKKSKGFDIANLKTNEDKELNGVWVTPYGNDMELLVARFNNTNMQEFVSKTQDDLKVGLSRRRRRQMSSANADIPLDKLLEGMSKYILLDWKNLQMDGVDVEYSKANALKLMKEVSQFADDVADIANNIALFQDETSEDSEEN